MIAPMKKAYKHEHAVSIAFDYNDDDLSANQNGELGVYQEKGLRLKFYYELLKLGAMALTWFSVSLILSLMFDEILLIPLIICGLLILNRSQRIPPFWKLYRDLRAGEVTSDEGRIQFRLWEKSTKSLYNLQLGERVFPIPQTALLTLKNGDPYRLYYLPRSEIILSAEWLHDDNPFIEDTKVSHVQD